MKKSFILGLVILLGFSTTAFAAITSLSTTGAWQTATGSLSGLLGQSAPATWTYDTDLSQANHLSANFILPSGSVANAYEFSSPTYGLSGTATPGVLDGNSFITSIIDNFVVSTDFGPDAALGLVMEDNGLDPAATYDWLAFSTSKIVNETNFHLSGSMFFDNDFFTGPITTLPTTETLMANFLLLTADLSADTGKTMPGVEGIILDGYASFAQVGAGPSAVPVPAAAFLFAPALLGFLGLRRKTKSAVV